MKEFLQLVLGTQDWPMYFAEWFFALIGVLLSLLLATTKRNPNSPTSPVHFSWTYMIADNAKRVLTSLILIFLFLRFSNELLGINISLFLALGIGLGLDKLAGYLKSKNILGIGQ